jgi:hypothetical protein
VDYAPIMKASYFFQNFHTISDRPKFGSVPAKIRTLTEIPVPVLAGFKVPVLAEISIQK